MNEFSGDNANPFLSLKTHRVQIRLIGQFHPTVVESVNGNLSKYTVDGLANRPRSTLLLFVVCPAPLGPLTGQLCEDEWMGPGLDHQSFRYKVQTPRNPSLSTYHPECHGLHQS